MPNKSFKNVAKVRYLRMEVTNINYIYEEIKRRFNVENTRYKLNQNALSSCLLSKYTRIKTFQTIISFVAFH
jgi:hypothetical protein